MRAQTITQEQILDYALWRIEDLKDDIEQGYHEVCEEGEDVEKAELEKLEAQGKAIEKKLIRIAKRRLKLAKLDNVGAETQTTLNSAT
ncbi:MAG: hypothetical protein LBI42_09555 [Chitinispirillales bacterium]|nr:hypothetical protein [Chitinispirillales bacterium]